MVSSYQESLDFLFSHLPMFSRTGAPAYKPGLETSYSLAEYFDNPHKKFKSIHIGGTNGKGSTSHMLASILQAAGYKTGLYTSPHLTDFRERMKINGKMIPQDKVIKFVNQWKLSGYEGKPSFFELTMIMAFNWFAEEKVDIAVIEVGMGGKLDSTNIIIPVLSVITNISHDHNQFLGETLQEIAREKAGIIKEKIPVVIGESANETEDIFFDTAIKKNSPIVFADKITHIEIESSGDTFGWDVKYGGDTVKCPLGGDYQKKNINTVITAAEQLKRLNYKISDRTIKSGIENVIKSTGLSGRWMIISSQPLTIADTGHNIAGLTYNFTQLKDILRTRPNSKLRVIIGFVADKAIDKILNILPVDAVYYTTNANIPRALKAEKLNELLLGKNLNSKVYEDPVKAYLEAKKDASENDVIFIGGSTFIVADFLLYLDSCVGRDS